MTAAPYPADTVGYGVRALFIGDSFTAGGGASCPGNGWASVLSDRQGWTCHNYAVGGAGFVAKTAEGSNYLQQTQRAAADGVDPDIILVSGGQNDYVTNTVAAIGTWLDFVHATWPNARVVGIPGTYRATAPPREITERYQDWLTAFETRGVELIPHAWAWLFGHPEKMAGPADPNHPNDAGHALIAAKVAAGLAGRSTLLNTGRFALTPAAGYTNVNAWGQIIEGVAHVWGGFAKTAGGSIFYLDKVFVVDSWWTPGAAPRRINALTVNGDNSTVVLQVSPAGTNSTSIAQITNHQGPLDSTLILPATSWPVGA